MENTKNADCGIKKLTPMKIAVIKDFLVAGIRERNTFFFTVGESRLWIKKLLQKLGGGHTIFDIMSWLKLETFRSLTTRVNAMVREKEGSHWSIFEANPIKWLSVKEEVPNLSIADIDSPQISLQGPIIREDAKIEMENAEPMSDGYDAGYLHEIEDVACSYPSSLQLWMRCQNGMETVVLMKTTHSENSVSVDGPSVDEMTNDDEQTRSKGYVAIEFGQSETELNLLVQRITPTYEAEQTGLDSSGASFSKIEGVQISSTVNEQILQQQFIAGYAAVKWENMETGLALLVEPILTDDDVEPTGEYPLNVSRFAQIESTQIRSVSDEEMDAVNANDEKLTGMQQFDRPSSEDKVGLKPDMTNFWASSFAVLESKLENMVAKKDGAADLQNLKLALDIAKNVATKRSIKQNGRQN